MMLQLQFNDRVALSSCNRPANTLFSWCTVNLQVGGLKEQVQQSVNFLSLLSETIPLPKHRYQWASDRTELT